ncbi:CLUMA_CG010710, isoform A [Clunio marinus]|uniref:CLUMA_CG010710, isoform A n=1 Tax=Clunio marinus TaxID=568069 RepID=A0A1J1ICN6_9DIPT|nr:CLUMA_CG010710, isoform A [Clunio marinus]
MVFSNLDIVLSVFHRDYAIHEGKNLTIPCGDSIYPSIWRRDGRNITNNYNLINADNSLMLIDVTSDDAGLYICSVLKNSSDSDDSYQEYAYTYVRVKTRPGAVGSFRAKATTIIAVLIWEAWRNRTGGSPIIYYTAEMRRLPGYYPNYTEEKVKWERLDPHHITPNARQLEVYHLKPNTSYQFRIWATNDVGPGEVQTITARTIEPTQEKDLILRILEDAKEFDTRIWIAAVAIGFCDTDDQRAPLSPIKTHFYGYGGRDDYDKDNQTFSRKMSIFFTGNTIKRI